MRKRLDALYSTLVYLRFLGTFVYAIGFIERILVPKNIDSGESGALAAALLVDVALLGVFAVQHSVMARQGFKRMWTRIVPEEAERSTYVLASTAALALLLWQWRPLPQILWSVAGGGAPVITALSWLGWALVLASTFLISHFHLFGVTQGFARLLRRHIPEQQFTTPLFYRWVRHPLYAGFIVAFWAAPVMTQGHLLFAAATTAYILLGIWLEERDLIAHFGRRYEEYRASVGMLLPRRRSAKGPH
jgi:protein-S-isoprenylcysteine O-methyltransferase Ste14